MDRKAMNMVVGVDAETYSGTGIEHGLNRYFGDPHFKVLLVSVSMQHGDHIESVVLDFVADHDAARQKLIELTAGKLIAAHNAMFEFAVLNELDIPMSPGMFVDSAVLARVAGLGSSLEAAAPQALGIDKLPSGKEGIQLFCIPGTYQMEAEHDVFDPKVVDEHPEQWDKFKEYCALDSALSLQLVDTLLPIADDDELTYAALTLTMNLEGWHVDVPLVEEMQRRYQENTDALVQAFRDECDAPTLNLFSHKQLVEWCLERGVKAKSFDEQSVEKLLEKVRKRFETTPDDDPRLDGYAQVIHLLETKQALGGSSLKKLQTILNSVSPTDRLFDQYLHAGAGTTLRTTGRGVQMQNLKRLGPEPDDVTELFDPQVHWTNEKMAHNLRQVFTATDPQGFLIVGDYKAVESRGLAWLAGEDWKLEAYRQGREVYREQAAKFYGKPAEEITKDERSFGKVGELSGGYQAGADAVKSFAEKMGVPLTLGEAARLVSDFRNSNPKTVQFWYDLQAALDEVMETGWAHMRIPEGTIDFYTSDAVDSLIDQTGRKDLKTLLVSLKVPGRNDPFKMRRIFHGLYRDGRSLYYWKPTARKTGDLWVPEYTDPKTGQKRQYSLYGGKLAGILTQSLCREIFMDGMTNMYMWTRGVTNARIIGQFHDEMVVDWSPPESVIDPDLDTTVGMLDKVMSTTDLPGFPLEADVKYAYRYTK